MTEPTRAPAGSDSTPVPRPTHDVLPPAVRALSDALGRPVLAKRLAAVLDPDLMAALTSRIGEIATKAGMTAEDRVSAEVIDRMVADAFVRLADRADRAYQEVRERSRLLEGDGPDVAELTRERFSGVSRG